ncbi:MAG: DNA primase family protein [Burkholderiaceae bacterium]
MTDQATGAQAPISSDYVSSAGTPSQPEKLQIVSVLSSTTEPSHDAANAAIAVMPVHIYTKAALVLLKLKCPVIRTYTNGDQSESMSGALISGLNRTLAAFDAGPETAHQACSNLTGFDQQRFDNDMAAGRLPETPCYTCAQARADGSSVCPAGGCPLPDGTFADSPLDLPNWNCNIKEVGHPILASSIVASEFRHQLISVRDKIYVLDNGIFTEVDETSLSNKIIPHLGPMGTMKQVAEIGKFLRIQNGMQMEFIQPNPNVICFMNGTLNVTTRRMEPHDPTHMLLNRIEHEYVRDAVCPLWLSFLHSIWESDADHEQKIRFLRQWLGYLLVADPRMQKMLILLGEGANGKSVLMDLVRGMIGEKNTASAMLDRLKLPYVRATMEGKLLNQSADLPKIGIVADGDMKAMISGDAIEVSPKFKPSYTIKPYVRLMVATNNLPSSKDTSEGYFRRLIILSFNRYFEEHERDPHLLQSLMAEMPGIIAWAVQGLYELREQGVFTIPASSIQAVQLYRDDISPVRMFADESLTPSPDRSGYSSRDLFMAYRAWCKDRGFDAGNMVALGRELATLGFMHRKSNVTVWLVKAKESGQEYFRPAVIVPVSTPPAA